VKLLVEKLAIGWRGSASFAGNGRAMLIDGHP